MTELSSVHKTLFRCLSRDRATADALSVMSDDQWEELLRITEDHGLSPVLYHRLTREVPGVSVPGEIGKKLRADYLASAARNTLLFADMTRLISALNENSIPVIVLKGAYLGPVVYGNITLRPMSDVDLLVRRGDLAKVQDLLLKGGYRPTAHVAVEESPEFFQELPAFINDNGITIDLHWHISDPRSSLQIDIEAIWDRAVAFSLDGKGALCLCQEDLVAYLCVHLAVNHAFDGGIRGLLDIYETIRHFGDSLDWKALEAQATAWGAVKSVRVVFLILEKWFGTRIPEHLTLHTASYGDYEAMVDAAERLILSTEGFVQDNVARLGESSTFIAKARFIFQRIFISRTELAAFYPVARTSPLIYFWYLRRAVDLLKRHGSAIPKLISKSGDMNPELAKAVERNKLRDWLLTNG